MILIGQGMLLWLIADFLPLPSASVSVPSQSPVSAASCERSSPALRASSPDR